MVTKAERESAEKIAGYAQLSKELYFSQLSSFPEPIKENTIKRDYPLVVSNIHAACKYATLIGRPVWRFNTILISLLLCVGVSLTGCKQDNENGYVMDMNGFVLGEGTDSKSAHPLYVGVGDSPERLLRQNPYLKGMVWIPEPGDSAGEMRLSLQSYSQIHYDDGDLKFDTCAYRSSIDGDRRFKRGVSVVGISLCGGSSLKDHHQAIRLAEEVINELKQRNPSFQDMREFYQNGKPDDLVQIGAQSWKEQPWAYKRKLYTFSEAENLFAEHQVHPKLETDTWSQKRPMSDNLMVGVFSGKRAVVEVTVNSSTIYGDNNLDDEKRSAMRYTVFIEIRLRGDVDINNNDPRLL
jgi:hypothetical protein